MCLAHPVREDLGLGIGIFVAQVRKEICYLEQLLLILPFKGFLLLFKAPIQVHVGTKANPVRTWRLKSPANRTNFTNARACRYYSPDASSVP